MAFTLRCIATAIYLAANALAHCELSVLKNATAQFVQAQTTGSSSVIERLASNLTYTENEKRVDIKTGILSQAVKPDHVRNVHDAELCTTFTEFIAATAEHPYVIGTRMVFSGDHEITLIESIVTDQGDWLFNATGYLHWNSLESWEPIPEDQRDSRETIQAAGDAYFDRFQNANVSVPFGTPCARLEGGAYTDPNSEGGNTCSLGLPSTTEVTNRRYVVDAEMGMVDIYLGFPGLDRSVVDQAMPDSHLFRVEHGQIKYIHTVSSCVNDGCGLNGTVPTRRSRTVRRSYRTY